MANASAVDVKNIKGQDPQFLIEKLVRTRIYESRYWKEECFGLSIESLVEKAVKLDHVGGMYGNQKATPFLCLTLKLLALQPSNEILDSFIQSDDFKYLKALTAMYIRLTGKSQDIYMKLEPLLNDYRKLRCRLKDANFGLTYLDEFVDNLLREDRFLDVKLPYLAKRHVLEERGDLEPRIPLISDDILDAIDGDDDGQDNDVNGDDSDADADDGGKLRFKSKGKEKSEEEKSSSKQSGSSNNNASLSIEETNALRAKLGLKPLQ